MVGGSLKILITYLNILIVVGDRSCTYNYDLFASVNITKTTFNTSLALYPEGAPHWLTGIPQLPCWKIVAPEGYFVQLGLTSVHLLTSSPPQHSDCLRIYDGVVTTLLRSLLTSLCHEPQDSFYNSSGHYLTVIFQQGDAAGQRWFNLNYRAVRTEILSFWHLPSTRVGSLLTIMVVLCLVSMCFKSPMARFYDTIYCTWIDRGCSYLIKSARSVRDRLRRQEPRRGSFRYDQRRRQLVRHSRGSQSTRLSYRERTWAENSYGRGSNQGDRSSQREITVAEVSSGRERTLAERLSGRERNQGDRSSYRQRTVANRSPLRGRTRATMLSGVPLTPLYLQPPVLYTVPVISCTSGLIQLGSACIRGSTANSSLLAEGDGSRGDESRMSPQWHRESPSSDENMDETSHVFAAHLRPDPPPYSSLSVSPSSLIAIQQLASQCESPPPPPYNLPLTLNLPEYAPLTLPVYNTLSEVTRPPAYDSPSEVNPPPPYDSLFKDTYNS